MRLAEGLVLRADTQKRIEQMRERLKASALVQEDEQPPEDPQELLSELGRLLEQLNSLVERINRTNMVATLSEGQTLMSALAKRDTLTLQFGILEEVALAASPRFDRLQRSEIKRIPTVKVAELRKKIDALARERRDLDTLIQAANWTVELLD